MSWKFLVAVPLASLLVACDNAPQGAIDQIGPNPTLPEPKTELLPSMRIATPVPWGDTVPTVPKGLRATLFAKDLQVPRRILALPNGDILVAEGSAPPTPTMRPKDLIAGVIKGMGKSPVKGGNRITLLRDGNGDGVAETQNVLVEGLKSPYDMVFVDNTLYVANADSLVRFALTPGMTQITEPPTLVTELPSEINHHWTKAMTLSADGTKLYVGIGSNSNITERGMEAERDRAMVWEIDRQTGAHRRFATGLRNPTGLAVHPQTRELWTIVNERDELGPDLVPDYMTSVKDGAFYGWPYSYWGQHVDHRVQPQNPDLVAKAVVPDYSLGSHVAALGIAFGTNDALGSQFSDGVFIGEHGSWNRTEFAGYKVIFVPFANGRPSGDPIDVATGFLNENGEARGRPVGVTLDQRGALLIADDLANVIWRVGPAQ